MATRKSTRAPARKPALPTPDSRENRAPLKGGSLSTHAAKQLRAGMNAAAKMVRDAGRVKEVLRAGFQEGEDDSKVFDLLEGTRLVLASLAAAGFRIDDGKQSAAEGFARALAYLTVYGAHGCSSENIPVDRVAEICDELEGVTTDVTSAVDELTISADRRNLGLDATYEIEALCESVRALTQVGGDTDDDAVQLSRLALQVRGITLRVEQLNCVVMSILDDDDQTSNLQKKVHGSTPAEEVSHG